MASNEVNVNSAIILSCIILFSLIGFLIWFFSMDELLGLISALIFIGLGTLIGILVGVVVLVLRKYLNFKDVNLLSTAKSVLFSPKSFYGNLAKEKGLKKSFTYFFTLSLVFLPFFIISQYYILSKVKSELTTELTIFIITLVIRYIIILITAIPAIAIFHYIFIRNFGGSGGFDKTFQAIIYAMTPLLILEWVPYVNILAGIYSYISAIIGLSILQKLNITKSAIIYTVYLVISAVLIYVMRY